MICRVEAFDLIRELNKDLLKEITPEIKSVGWEEIGFGFLVFFFSLFSMKLDRGGRKGSVRGIQHLGRFWIIQTEEWEAASEPCLWEGAQVGVQIQGPIGDGL